MPTHHSGLPARLATWWTRQVPFKHGLLFYPFIAAAQLKWEQFPISLERLSLLAFNLMGLPHGRPRGSCSSHGRGANAGWERRSGSVEETAGIIYTAQLPEEIPSQQPLHTSCSVEGTGLNRFLRTLHLIKKVWNIFDLWEVLASYIFIHLCMFMCICSTSRNRSWERQGQGGLYLLVSANLVVRSVLEQALKIVLAWPTD